MYGVIKETIEPIRLYDYETVCGSAETGTYPIEYEIPRENTGTLKKQQYMSCVGCVIAQITEELMKRKFGETSEMSESFSYAAFRDSQDLHTGLVVSEALAYWKKIGSAVTKEEFPVEEEMPEIRKILDTMPALYDIAKRYKIAGYASLNYADKNKKLNAVKQALTEMKYPLLAVSDDYFGGSHCIMVTGWNDSNEAFKIKNSWGDSYGDNGFSEIPHGAVNKIYAIFADETKLPFVDVNKNQWFYKYIRNMYFNGLMNGTSETTFEPDAPMTRAQVATLMYNVIKKTDDRFAIVNEIINAKTKNYQSEETI